MNRNDESWDDQQMADLFAAVSRQRSEPDDAFLAQLREESTRAFEEASRDVRAKCDSPHDNPNNPYPRKSKMTVLAWRVMAAATAAAAIVAAMIFAPTSGGAAAGTLGKVLETIAGAQSLKLEITIDGKKSELFSSRPGRLRWNLGDGVYQIARGDRAWQIDEKANRASSRKANYFVGKEGGLDALGLLNLGDEKSRKAIAAAKAHSHDKRDGADCDIFKVSIASATKPMELIAVVDVATGMLRSIEIGCTEEGKFRSVSAITVAKVNEAVSEDLFAFSDTLTEDGRVGKITDAQGICAVKPVMSDRWTPVSEGLLVMPGDWLRTDLRGANAISARLVKETMLTLGPGALVEVVSPKTIRVSSGDVKITTTEGAPIEVTGPAGPAITVKGAQTLRVAKDQLTVLDKEPAWLKGFESRAVGESIGSLVANIDGRNTPLTVGYHKVTVDIRDQIARTAVEESFANHTDARLEGTFHFPLPQDASISGFGMWIGDELVEADVVEKQRAREIYETILRERRDPGLLEWSGGNIFKARVFPIEAHSEKRVKITYTQVLPLRGNSYRYSYALQSEMLKQNPLRELAIDVKVNSVVPLKSVASPTHLTRGDQTANSAHVEFTAQEYTPTRDFEVIVETEGKQSDVVMIPHRRGDDGYFMVLLTPPGTDSGWQRDVLPTGQPMDLLILADTSASLDSDSRAKQAEFIAALLGSLTPADTVNLACCDVECDWALEKAGPATPETIATLRDTLSARVSLGWTDLDKALASAVAKAGAKTQIVYCGDGIVTTGDADPVAFAKRVKQLYAGKPGTCHAVTVSSSFEATALKAMSSLGGGSVRQITGERGPQVTARELLSEMAKPSVRDLSVDFRGLRTARVYPKELPTLAAGSQQIILGRYLPEGKDQSGEVIVKGMLDGKPVQFTAKASLKDAEEGNSFIPRLWARMHLDELLAQGSAQAVQDEIIALSEEYHIMTPYTSLLVLESDADRERFGVKRRFLMRDGEKFFAQGRDNADYELVQQQMKRAGSWRLGLRRTAIAQLANLGRGPIEAPRQAEMNKHLSWSDGDYAAAQVPMGMSATSSRGWAADAYADDGYSFGRMHSTLGALHKARAPMNEPVSSMEFQPLDRLEANGKAELGLGDLDGDGTMQGKDKPEAESTISNENDEKSLGFHEFDKEMAGEEMLFAERSADMPAEMPAKTPMPILRAGIDGRFSGGWGGRGRESSMGRRNLDVGGLGFFAYETGKKEKKQSWNDRGDGYYGGGLMLGNWLNPFFPQLPAPPIITEPKEAEKPWPAEAKALAESLLRTEQIVKLPGGLEIDEQSDSFDVRGGELSGRNRTLAMLSSGAWLTLSEGEGSQTTIQWSDKQQRGMLGKGFGLGRIRDAAPADLDRRAWPLSLPGYAFSSLAYDFREYLAEIKPQDAGRTLLVLTNPNNKDYAIKILIDTTKRVVLSIEHRQDGKVTSTTRFGDFVEAAGAWWPGKVEGLDDKGRRMSLTSLRYSALAADAFAAANQKQLACREQVQFLRDPMPKLVDAKKALAAGKASFEDQILLMAYFAESQQWTRVMEHLEHSEKLAAGKQGMRWLHDAVMNMGRKREELKARIMEEAARLAKAQPAIDDLFLARHLFSQGQSILEANETLRLLDVLKPVYDRQGAFTLATKQWRGNRISYLQQTGQASDAMEMLKQLAGEYPRDYSLQQQYAYALSNSGDHGGAFAHLKSVLDGKVEWFPYEEDSLRAVAAQMLQSQGHYPKLVEFLADWVRRDPQSSSPYDQYLSALVHLDKVEEAEGLMRQWLKEARVEGKLAQGVSARLDAAVAHALGQGQNLYTNRIDEQWLVPMAETALFFAKRETQSQVADRIMGAGPFAHADACRNVRKAVAQMLLAEIDSLKPEQIQRFVGWIMANDPAVEQQEWRKIADGLRKRWTAETKVQPKHQLGQILGQILSAKLTSEESIAFLRLEIEQGPKEYRIAYLNQLFGELLGQPWSKEGEEEAIALLTKLSDAEEPAVRPAAEISALLRLTDAMVAARTADKMKAVEHPEKLTRSALRAKQNEANKAAREGFADRLAQERGKREGRLAQWMNVERLTLDVQAPRNLKQVIEECWEALGAQPPKPAAEDDLFAPLDEALRGRYLTVAMNLACRKGAEPAVADRLLGYLDAGIAVEGESMRYRMLKYQLLLALDRSKDLETAMRAWIAADGTDNRWRLTLGYLLAEQGKLAEAIALFDAVAAADELGPAEYRTLADWHIALNHREACDKAKVAAYKTMEEYMLSNFLQAKLRPWQQQGGQIPAELDKEVLLIFAALFEKSQTPQNHVWQLQQFYRETRDFRLLAGLAQGMIGHTAGKAYPFLQGLQSILSEVRDEATADSIVEEIAKARPGAKTVVDNRALDLLEAIVQRRAAEVMNQAGPHADRAVAAMQRAFQPKRTPGEGRLLAELLTSLGQISQPKLAAEQLRELETLYAESEKDTIDRLIITTRLATARWYYKQDDGPIDLLTLGLAEYIAASGGSLKTEANDSLSTLIMWHQQRGHYAKAEEAVLAQQKRPANAGQANWLIQQLFSVYEAAIRAGGETSLGGGEKLYKAVEGKLHAALDATDSNHRYQLLNRLCGVYRAAKEKKFAGVADDLKAFAAKQFPELAGAERNNLSSMVSQVGSTLHDVASPRDALAFLITQIEREPRWLRMSGQNSWSSHGWTLAHWRTEVKDLGELDPQLLKIVLAELQWDLRSQQSRSRSMYDCQQNLYWAEKESKFREAAEEVYAERKASGAAVAYIAEYLYTGLHHYDRAIEMLLAADKQGLLDENAQSRLVECLHQQKRFGESIAILLPLVERRPDRMQYRTWLMHAYFQTHQGQQLLTLLKQTDEHFHENDRWTEPMMAALGYSCLENQLFEQSVKYYDEAIAIHQRTAPNRGIGDGTLSAFFGFQANAYAGLKKTAEAVEAACGAIVSWGPRADNRAGAIEALKQVLRGAAELDAYVAELDKKEAETGLGSPIVRKALGQVYLERNTFDKAVVQLKLACDLQPNDTETHQALISAFDKQNDKQGAIRQLLASLQLSRRDIKLYQDLGRRYEELKQPQDAERANTSIVEMLPSESESHAALAEIRQRQNRSDEAIVQWEQVARIRALEPTGLLSLAKAQIQFKRWDAAADTLRRLEARTWPTRFNDAQQQIFQLRQQVEQGKNQPK